jgi:hypothetical protein
MRRAMSAAVVSLVLAAAGAGAAVAAEGPPIGGCPPAGGWTLRLVTEPGAPDEADVNGDGWLCGRDMEIPAFPGFDNYIDNVLKITQGP